MIKVVGSTYKVPENVICINTTSRSNNWSVGLSPFFVGPIKLYDEFVAKNMENAWQYSKLYDLYAMADNIGNPTEEYFRWAINGWSLKRANRYPMGKDNKPLCSIWKNDKLDYVSARKTIYVPLYSNAVRKTDAFKKLKEIYSKISKDETLYLFDFDAYSLTPNSFKYEDLINNPNIKFGHGYVLAMMLEGIL